MIFLGSLPIFMYTYLLLIMQWSETRVMATLIKQKIRERLNNTEWMRPSFIETNLKRVHI